MSSPPPAPPAGSGPLRRGVGSNPWRVCAFHAVQMSLFPMAIITVFYRLVIGMSMRDIFVLQGCFGLAMVLMEFPSGYVADRIGYRRSLLLASGLMTAGWAIYAGADRMVTVILAEVVLGVGTAFISGCDVALLYESLVESGREAEYGTWNGRMRFCGQVAEGSAALVAGLLYAAWPRAPFVIETVLWGAGVAIAWRIVEPARHRPGFEASAGQLRAIVSQVAQAPDLVAVMATTIVLGMASFVPVWSIQIHATASGMPTSLLGPFWAAANFIVALGALGSARARRLLSLHGLMGACVVLVAVGYLAMGLVPTAAGACGYFLLTLMRGLFGPALQHEEQRRIGSRDRAGVLSLRSLVFRGSFCVVGPLVGALMDRHGHRPVYLWLGAVLVAAALGAWALMAARGVGTARGSSARASG